jgi:outer membrane protein assembly factor BamB
MKTRFTPFNPARLALASCALFLLVTSPANAQVRTWTEAETGRTIQGQMVSGSGDSITVRMQAGRTVDIPLDRLSEADREFIAANPPAPAAAGAAATAAGDWPQWRGPLRDGISAETALLERWPADGPKQLWVYRDAGLGYSGPAIVGGMLYTMGVRQVDGQEYTIALNAETGEEQWTATIGRIYTNNWGDGPRSTPTVAGDKLVVLGANGDLVCLQRADGRELWRKSLTADFGGDVPQWGYTESPLVDGDRVVVTPGGGAGAIVALDLISGDEQWRAKDVTDGAQYSSVIAADHNGTRQYIQLFMNTLAGVEADTGKLLWKTEFPGRTAVIPTPIFHDRHVYVTAGYGVGCKLIRLDPGHEVVEVYSNNVMVNHHGGVVLIDGHLYGHSDGGGWTCQNFLSGERVWAEGDAVRKGAVHAAGGMLYCLDETNGDVVLAEASPDGWNERGRFQISPQTELRKPSGRIWTHPVVSNGRLYLRDQELVYCYDVSGR